MASHYEQRLAQDLAKIRESLKDVSGSVASGLDRAIRALRADDRDTLHDVVIDDLEINRKIRAIDGLCHAFVARHLPAAGHLRFISSVLRLTVAMERAGDYAVTICRVLLQLERRLADDIIDKIAEMTELSRTMLVEATDAFLAVDADLAGETKRQGIKIDHLYDAIFHQLINEQPRRPPIELASLLTIFGRIERVSDQAKNICEETVFAATGEAKAPKVFRILFLDERNDLTSQLAAAIARKGFPNSGEYSSAGWKPVSEVDARIEGAAERYLLDVTRARPTKVVELTDMPIHYHVVVALNAGEGADLPHIPYHTILRRWGDLPAVTATEGPELEAQLDALVRELKARIRSLMERLRGDAAN